MTPVGLVDLGARPGGPVDLATPAGTTRADLARYCDRGPAAQDLMGRARDRMPAAQDPSAPGPDAGGPYAGSNNSGGGDSTGSSDSGGGGDSGGGSDTSKRFGSALARPCL